jgi:hypothetical protein
MMKMNITHSVPHRHGSSVQFGEGVVHIYDENEHLARTGAPFHFAADLSSSITLATPPEPLKLKLVWGII